MGLLDTDHKTLGETVVQHKTDLPGLYRLRKLAYPPEEQSQGDFLYEQRKGQRRQAHSIMLDQGYHQLAPLCDPVIIRNRQEIIRSFLNDLNDKKAYFPILNIMHLINEWTRIDRRYSGGLPDSKKSAGFLKRYLAEADKFSKLLKKEGGLLEKLAEHYARELPREDIELLARACDKGEFDSIIIGKENGAFVFKGVVGDNKPVNVPNKSLGRYSLYEQTGCWTQPELVWAGFRKGLGILNKLYSPVAALYFEADYMRRRQREGKNVCLPNINEEGRFEMIEGEPILLTPHPKARNFSFDKNNARAILNGLHSAGKTYLICDIPLYIIRGLQGFPLPSKDADIPITRRIFHALEIEKRDGGGSLHSELVQRAEEINLAREGDLHIIDEFLQHASPDAAEPLEPIILEAYEKTKATFIIVDHRGEAIEDGKKWNFWSPEYIEHSSGEINPTFRFSRGKPSNEILTRHAKQLLEKVARELDIPKQEKEKKGHKAEWHNPFHDGENPRDWEKRIEERALGGKY